MQLCVQPADGPADIQGKCSPYKSARRPVCLEVGGVNHQGIELAILNRQVAKILSLHPAPIAIMQRLVRSALACRILPLKPVFEHINDAQNHPPLINKWNPSERG